MTHSLTHILITLQQLATHSLTHTHYSIPHSCTHTHSLTHITSLHTHSLTHSSLTHTSRRGTSGYTCVTLNQHSLSCSNRLTHTRSARAGPTHWKEMQNPGDPSRQVKKLWRNQQLHHPLNSGGSWRVRKRAWCLWFRSNETQHIRASS